MNGQDKALQTSRFRRLMVVVLALGALGLYGATLSRGAFPGLPARSLAWHLWLDSAPTLLDSLWGRLVRLCAPAAGTSLALWMGWISALFGAACVALVTVLTTRLRYSVHDTHDPDEMGRENQARLLAGLTAGLFVAVSIPFWVLSTRSLPGTFHLFLLLLATFLFSEYQRTGKPVTLYGMGLVFGVGITEFPTFWIFAPFAALLVIRAMLQRAEFSWPVLIRTALCLVPGLLLYIWNGWTLWMDPAVRLRGFGSMGSVIWYIWRDQWHLVVNAPQTTGFLMVMVLTVVPWGVLFLMRPKKPAWRYSAWQVGLRLVVLAAALGTLLDAWISPWRYFGMQYLMATPYLILAACAGRVAGEFWVMGQVREHRNAGIGHPLRRTMGLLGALVPLGVLAAGVLNFPVADGRPGGAMDTWSQAAVDALGDRDVVISDGGLDDSLRILAHQQGKALTVITVPQTTSKLYRDYLAEQFNHPRQQALLQVGFGAFMQDYLLQDENLERTAGVDITEPLREHGYLVPDRLIYRAEGDESKVDLDALAEQQRDFWAQMEAYAAEKLDERNPAYGYRGYILRTASKLVNNLGFALVDRGNEAQGEALFQEARRIYPDNISALLNLLTIAQADNRPELAQYEAEWERFKERHVDSRVMWSLSSLYGYIHNTGFLVRHGMMWAVSGKPRMAEAELRRASAGGVVDANVKAFLARAYLQSGDVQQSEKYYRELLEADPSDIKSQLMLVQLCIRSENYDEAERLLARAEESGINPIHFRFERAVLAYLEGRPDAALAALKALVAQKHEDVRAWALLAMLTADGRDDETYEKALKAMQNLRGTSPDVRLMLAELFMSRQDWAQARAELDQVTRMNPRLVRAWELLVNVDFKERKQELAEDHVRILLTLDPENYIGNLMLGAFQYDRAQYALAESSYRAALAARRTPEVMNDLAYLLMVKGGALEESDRLIDEALAVEPGNPVFLSTRAELRLAQGRLDEAVADLQQVMAAMPDHPPATLLAAQVYAARGQEAAALEMAESLEDRQGELAPDQQLRLQALLAKLR